MDIDQVIRHWLAGERIRAIARLTGTDRNTLRRIMRFAEEAGVWVCKTIRFHQTVC